MKLNTSRAALFSLVLCTLILCAECLPGFVRRMFREKKYVTVPLLYLRAAPNTAAPIMNLLPYGTEIDAVSEGPEVEEAGAKGNWYRVSPEGYAFGAYLSSEKIPVDASKGIQIVEQSSFIVCMSDTSNFSIVKLWLSSGRVRYEYHSHSACISPNQIDWIGEGRYSISGHNLLISIDRGDETMTYEPCGMKMKEPDKKSLKPFQKKLRYSAALQGFITDETEKLAASADYVPDQKKCFFKKKIEPDPFSAELCREPRDPVIVNGYYCLGPRKAWK